MISGLCGFAELLRRHGGDVGSAELIDAAGALTLTDLADRRAVRRAIELTFSWSTVNPDLFDRLFDEWFSGHQLAMIAAAGGSVEATGDDESEYSAVGLDVETIDAARIHTDEAVLIESEDGPAGEHADGSTGTGRSSPGTDAPTLPSLDGISVAATGELAPTAPHESDDAVESSGDLVLVDLPDAPLDWELEMAREALAEAIEHRHQVEVVAASRRVKALSAPLSADERLQLARFVRRIDQRLNGAPSWRRARNTRGVVDVRRTMRRIVTTAGLPIDLRHTGRRNSAPRLLVLVDLSMSVRGTARLVLHLVHRLRSMRGSLRVFGFVDSCVSIDRALRVDDPALAIGRVLSLVDVNASSDPGLAFRQWWARSHHLVTAETHILMLGDGRCNGRDPAFDVVEWMTRASASTVWVSPEPEGAWTLGRGEMAHYAELVDQAITVRSIADLEQLAAKTSIADRPQSQVE